MERPGSPNQGPPAPWYRQFWPWFLIFLPGSVVVAAFVTLYIANKGADDLVVDDYYKDGLAINQQIEKQKLARDLGILAHLQYLDGVILVHIEGTQATLPAELDLLLSHPLEADKDLDVQLLKSGENQYRATLELDAGTRWHWILENKDEPIWRLDGDLKINTP